MFSPKVGTTPIIDFKPFNCNGMVTVSPSDTGNGLMVRSATGETFAIIGIVSFIPCSILADDLINIQNYLQVF